jgi:ATP adenylyltransferase
MDCRFCSISQGRQVFDYDRPFYRSEGFFGIASIGALVPGWSLLCPDCHTTSLRSLYSDRAFRTALKDMVDLVTKSYGAPVVFEHGSAACGSLTGCGVDHAHLHVVPIGKSLIPAMLASGVDWQPVVASNLCEIPSDKEYLFYAEKLGDMRPEGWAHILSAPASQYFRKILADVIGRPTDYDYKLNPSTEIALDTQSRLELAHIRAAC